MKIIVAEDDAVSRHILENALKKAGHKVTCCENGKGAWDQFCHNSADLIISDWMMPEMDGIELCRKVRGHTASSKKYTYFIMLTLKNSIEDHETAINAGVDDFLSKPLGHIELTMRLRVAQRIIQFGEQIESLREILPICMYCKRIHASENYWERLEAYFEKYKSTDFSHGICPECYEKVIEPQLKANAAKF